MIFINKIKDEFKMVQYFQSLLSELLCKKWDQIIQTFLSNQELSRQEIFKEEFENRNTRILIYIDTAWMGVNIRDVTYAIQ